MENARICLICLALAVPCGARTITVDDDGPAEFTRIQDAIDDSNDGDVIIVSDGVYTGNGNRDMDYVGRAITLQSENGPENCIIDCQASPSDRHRAFYFHNGEGPNSVLDGFTIKNGCAYNGGAIKCRLPGGPIIRNCIIRDNEAPAGPGYPFYVLYPAGAFYGYLSSAIIENCQFLNNTASGCGGAFWLFKCNILIRNCVISGNHAVRGGGFFLIEDTTQIENSLIIGNSSDGPFGADGGGGIFSSESTPIIRNCTLYGNSAVKGGGGIYVEDEDCVATVANCILWGNSAPEGAEIRLQYGSFGPGSLTISYSNVQGGAEGAYIDPGCTLNWLTGNIEADPCFYESVNGDYHLKSQAGRWDPNSESWVKDDLTSPCIDEGDPISPIGLEPFPNGGIINIGAYGGTTEASKSYFDKPPCEIIVAGDINGDCIVDWRDFAIMTLHWLVNNNPVNSNSIVEYGIEYYIQTDKAVYHLGENVEMLFRLTNLRDEDVNISCSKSPEFNFKAELCLASGLCLPFPVWIYHDGPWACYSPGIDLSPGESTEVSYSWDMKDIGGNLVLPTTDYPPGTYYNVVGFIYNEPWNYDNGEGYIETEVGVPITITP